MKHVIRKALAIARAIRQAREEQASSKPSSAVRMARVIVRG